MKKIEAVIGGEKLAVIKNGLSRIGIKRLVLLQAQDWGGERPRPMVFRGTEYLAELAPKVKVEFVVEDELAEPAVEIITKAMGGKSSESDVYVSTVESAQCLAVG